MATTSCPLIGDERVVAITPGDRVVVLGPGTIGILCAAMARLCGAEVAVVGLEADKGRLAIAEKYGCEGIVGSARDWAFARDGLGCDGVVDAAGASATLKLALDLVRPAGWISKVGWGHSSTSDFATFVRRTEPGRAFMFHHDPTHDDETLEAMRDDAAELARLEGREPGGHGHGH